LAGPIGPLRALTRRCRRIVRVRGRAGWRWLALAALALTCGVAAGCTSYHGPLTPLGQVEEYPAGRWAPTPSAGELQIGFGVYPIPQYHLMLVHIVIPDTSRTSLGPGAVHGAVGVWWVALDDRVPHGGALVYAPRCLSFVTLGSGAQFDIVGDYLAGPAAASLSRYPLSFNSEDGSVSVALSPQDEIAGPTRGQSGAPPPVYLRPAPGVSCAGP
jgi:hypothetical protein